MNIKKMNIIAVICLTSGLLFSQNDFKNQKAQDTKYPTYLYKKTAAGVVIMTSALSAILRYQNLSNENSLIDSISMIAAAGAVLYGGVSFFDYRKWERKAQEEFMKNLEEKIRREMEPGSDL